MQQNDDLKVSVSDSYNLELVERRKKSIESKNKVLRKLMAEFPEFVKEVLEQNGN